jgi:hypothetical protein
MNSVGSNLKDDSTDAKLLMKDFWNSLDKCKDFF